MRSSLSNSSLPAVLAFMGAAAFLSLLYGPRLSTPLAWDDRETIVFNSEFDRALPWRDFFTQKYFSFSREATWRPLATLSYSALIRAFGKSPFALRLAMLLAHLLNASLLWAFLRRAGMDHKTTLGAAALFLIHPAHGEVLMCVSFNEEILTTLGILAMLLAHQRGRPMIAALGFICALLSKETGIIGALLLPIYDAATRGKEACRRHLKTYAGLGAPACVYLYLRLGPLKGPVETENLQAALPVAERLYYSIAGLGSALRVFALPLRLRIEYFALPPDNPLQGALVVLGGLGAAVGLFFLMYRGFKMERRMAFFLAWPVLFWLPVSHLAPVGVLSLRLLAERWLYLPSLGACAALGRWLPRKWIGLLLIFWLACGTMRLRDWSSETALWNSLAGIYPWCAKAQEGLGEAYFRSGYPAHALAAFEKAQSLRDSRQDKVLARYVPLTRALGWESPALYRWLALSHWKLGHKEQAKAFFLKAQNLQPQDGYTYRALSYLCAELGDWRDAAGWLKKGLARDPQDDFLKRLKPDVERKRLVLRAQFN